MLRLLGLYYLCKRFRFIRWAVAFSVAFWLVLILLVFASGFARGVR